MSNAAPQQASTSSRGVFPPFALSNAAWLRRPVSIQSLVGFRIAFGCLLLWEVWRYAVHGWIGSVFLAPSFHFKYPGWEWVQPWPGIGMYAHFAVLGVLAALIAVGWFYRVAAVLFSCGFTYLLLLDRAHYLNHFYLICLVSLVLAFVPAHQACSVDAGRRPSLRSDVIPAWGLWILRLQLAIPYVYGGLAKLNGDWLRGQPMQMWMTRMDWLRPSFPVFGEHWLAVFVSYAALLIDLFAVPLLLWRRTQLFAFAVAVVFHLFNAAMFRIGIFPWLMIAATTLFLPPDWPSRWLWKRIGNGRRGMNDSFKEKDRKSRKLDPRRIGGRAQHSSRADSSSSSWGAIPRVTAVILAIHFLLQLLLPFRHFLYRGDVDWTEEGSRFAWRMMLCDKAGAMRFEAVVPGSPLPVVVDPRAWLTREQLDRLSREPDLQREFATFLKREFTAQGCPATAVHVVSLCSLNGRKAQYLVDPTVDLGAEPAIWSAASWIVPLREPLRRQPWLIPQSLWEREVGPYRPENPR